jgi:hypothetical protein
VAGLLVAVAQIVVGAVEEVLEQPEHAAVRKWIGMLVVAARVAGPSR